MQCWNNVAAIQNNVGTILQRCIALKNRSCESSSITSPLKSFYLERKSDVEKQCMRGQKGKPSVKSLNILSLIAKSFKIILFWVLH